MLINAKVSRALPQGLAVALSLCYLAYIVFSIIPPATTSVSRDPQRSSQSEAYSSPILASTRGDRLGSSLSSRSSALTTRTPSVSLP